MPNWPSEPPTGNVVQFLSYYVYFRIREDYDDAVDLFEGATILRSPSYIKAALGISETAFGFQVDDAERAMAFPYPPSTVIRTAPTGAWAAPQPIQNARLMGSAPDANGNPYAWPPVGYTVDYNVDWFTAPGWPNLGAPIGAGRDTTFIWMGILQMMPTQNADPEEEITWAEFKPRRWICGFEIPNSGTGSFTQSPEGWTGSPNAISRDASRTPDGLGFALRGAISELSINLSAFGTASTTYKSWETLYIRPRYAFPSSTSRFWTALNDQSGEARLSIDSTGHIVFSTLNNFSTVFVNATSAEALELDEWVRVDILLRFKPRSSSPSACQIAGATDGANAMIVVYVNGLGFINSSGTVHDGFGVRSPVHVSSRVGSPGVHTLSLDIDDWRNQEHPSQSGACTSATSDDVDLNRLDWVYPFHVQLARPTELTSSTNWSGNKNALIQIPTLATPEEMSSSTSGATLLSDTEVDNDAATPGAFFTNFLAGVISMISALVGSRATQSTTGKIGQIYDYEFHSIDPEIDIVVAIDSDKTITEILGLQGYGNLVFLADNEYGLPVYGTLQLRHIKSTDAVVDDTRLLMGVMEALIDPAFPSTVDLGGLIGNHNAPFTSSILGYAYPPNFGAVSVYAGTYVGNGTGQDISIDAVGIHFIWIRNTSAGTQTCWWSTMLGPHDQLSSFNIYPCNTRVTLDPETNQTILHLAGGQADGNQNGITYQIIAFSDPTSRVMLNGAMRTADGSATQLQTLFDPEFTPEGMFFTMENLVNVLSGDQVYWKGPGNAANSGCNLDSGEVSNVATFGTGSFTSRAVLNDDVQAQIAYCAVRSNDGGITINPLCITQYTGDGTGARTITVNLGGRRPLFAIIAPMGARAWMRDPSHTTNNSNHAGEATTGTTSITGGGIDQIIVGSTLNANGVVYSVFAIPGGTTAGNGGWSQNGGFVLSDAPGFDEDTYPPYLPQPPAIPADVTIMGAGGLLLTGEAPRLLVENLSGLYTLETGKRNDTIITRSGDPADVAIPDPNFKTGFING